MVVPVRKQELFQRNEWNPPSRGQQPQVLCIHVLIYVYTDIHTHTYNHLQNYVLLHIYVYVYIPIIFRKQIPALKKDTLKGSRHKDVNLA